MTNDYHFNIVNVMDEVARLRKGFTLESDFQFILGCAIKNLYKEHAEIIMEYKYPKEALINNQRQNIDILVIINNKCYPIELKYNYKYENYETIGMSLTNHIKYKLDKNSKGQHTTDYRKKYCLDIVRLLKLYNTKNIEDDQLKNIEEAYAIMLTDFEEFRKNKNHISIKWSLYEEDQTRKEMEELIKKEKIDPIYTYEMKWHEYKNSSNKFNYLVTTIKRKDSNSKK